METRDCMTGVLAGDDAGWPGHQCWTGGAGLDCVSVSEHYCSVDLNPSKGRIK